MRTFGLILVGALSFVGCNSDDTSEKQSEIRSEQLADWQDMPQQAKDIVCDIYDEAGRDNEDWFIEQMTQGSAGDSREVAQAKVDIMKEEC